MARRKQHPVSRRRILKGAAAAAGAWPFFHIPKGFAEDAIGNWPDGVKGDTAFIGITTPLTGPYSAEGDDLLKGYQLAIEHLNSGGGLVSKISTLSGKGVLKLQQGHENPSERGFS